MKNKYLISVVECSKQYNVPRDKLYGAIRAGNTEIPYIKIGNITRINVPLFEEYLNKKSALQEEIL